MDTKSYALPLNRKQLEIVRQALDARSDPGGTPVHDHLSDQISTYIDWLTNIPPKDLYLEVLGWNPRAVHWKHVFTWTGRMAERGLEAASIENEVFKAGFTHFVIVPIPAEQENAT
jgi:hypothetical protein